MRQLLFRVGAYVTAGPCLGGAFWLTFNGRAEAGGVPVLAIALLIPGLVVSILLLTRSGDIVLARAIRINPPWGVAAMDSICIAASATAAFFVFDGYAGLLFGLARGATDPLAADIIAFMYLPSALVLALFVTSSGSQHVRIDPDGICIAGAFEVKCTSWRNIAKLGPASEYVTVSRLGNPVPSRLRTNLEIKTRDGDRLVLYQPGLKATAAKILVKLQESAPQQLIDDLEDISAAWL